MQLPSSWYAAVDHRAAVILKMIVDTVGFPPAAVAGPPLVRPANKLTWHKINVSNRASDAHSLETEPRRSDTGETLEEAVHGSLGGEGDHAVSQRHYCVATPARVAPTFQSREGCFRLNVSGNPSVSEYLSLGQNTEVLYVSNLLIDFKHNISHKTKSNAHQQAKRIRNGRKTGPN